MSTCPDGFKSSPEEVAQLIFDQLDFGEEAPVPAPEEKESVPLDDVESSDDEPVEELVELCQSLEPLDKPFHLCMENKPMTFFFGSHWALVVLWTNAAEIWNIRDRGDDGAPVLIARIESREHELFRTAAVSDQETISPNANSRLYILATFSWTRCRWSMIIINLNTGVMVNKGRLIVFKDNQKKNIVNGRIACSPTNAVTFIALNYATNKQQPCKLWELGTGRKLKEFTENPIPSIKSIAVLSPEKESLFWRPITNQNLQPSICTK